MPTLTKIGRNTIHDSAISTAQLADGQVLIADIEANAKVEAGTVEEEDPAARGAGTPD